MIRIKISKGKLLVFALILIIAWRLGAQEIQRESVASEVKRHFLSPKPNFAFSEEVPGEDDLTKQVNSFFKQNFLYVDYLSREAKDYEENLVDTVCAFLESRGWKISHFSPQPKTPISVHELKTIAVRHIFPLRLTSDGSIATLICAAAAGFKDFSERNIALEAFTFQTIFSDLKKEPSFVLSKVREYGQLAKSMKLSTNPDDLIKRAQGIYWVLFYQNKEFEALLLAAYTEKAKILPFEIIAK